MILSFLQGRQSVRTGPIFMLALFIFYFMLLMGFFCCLIFVPFVNRKCLDFKLYVLLSGFALFVLNFDSFFIVKVLQERYL